MPECTASQNGLALCNTLLQEEVVEPWGKVPCCGDTEGSDPASGCGEQPAAWHCDERGVEEEEEASWRACGGQAGCGLMVVGVWLLLVVVVLA